MARIVILGAGISGHTAALHLNRMLGKSHQVIVVSPNSNWNWIPSNIWVGVGKMDVSKVVFPLAPIYRRLGIEFHQAKATVLHPEGDGDHDQGFVEIEYTDPAKRGQMASLSYDYLINATGPQLKFGATSGLGPDAGNTVSVCTPSHATQAAGALASTIEKMKAGQNQTLVIGTGNGTCTCEGAAFEYVFNVEHCVRQAGVRDKARIIYFTNEAKLGDFGVGGMTFNNQGFQTTSDLWTESLLRERGVEAVLGAAATSIKPGVLAYEQIDGSTHELAFDFAMLLPPFGGVPLTAFDKQGIDISAEMFNPAGFMKVDADYTPRPYEEWKAKDWPNTYRTPKYDNVFAVGIAFAPPHQISRPIKNPNGTMIAPAPPRTGMPSGVMGKAVAQTIADRIKHGPQAKSHEASMAKMGAACVASTGVGLTEGSAASMTMMPVVPDFDTYPTGRDLNGTRGEIGLAGHWLKYTLHHLFIYKAKALPGWQLIPE